MRSYLGESTKVLTIFPETLLQKVDGFSATEGLTRSEVIRRAVAHYMKLQTEIQMRRGYEEMAEINLALAEEAILADEQQLSDYEKRL